MTSYMSRLYPMLDPLYRVGVLESTHLARGWWRGTAGLSSHAGQRRAGASLRSAAEATNDGSER